MQYPDKAPFKQLEAQHSEYQQLLPAWQMISDFKQGSATLLRKADTYLPKRPGEEPDVYQLRLKKFSYTPVMSNAIREFTSKLASSPVHVSETNTEAFWQDFFEHIDGANQDQAELLNDVFGCLLYFGRVYLAVDKPKVDQQPRSALEADQMGLRPYVSLWEPLLVTNWGDGWYMTRQVIQRNQPLEAPANYLRWQFWDAQYIATYEAQVSLKPDGTIDKIIRPDREYSTANTKIDLVSLVPHGLGRLPIVSLTLPEEMWTGNSVYLKQKQHTLIENSWTDAGSIAGTVQRVFTPPPALPLDDPRVVFEQRDYSGLTSSNAHILVGSGFKFEESSGSAIAALTSQLETIERQIRDLVSMGYLSASHKKGAVTQSGDSKEVDMVMLADSMRAYGKKVAQLYQDVLQLVALAAGLPDRPNVQGLDTYSINTLRELVDLFNQTLSFITVLPPTAVRVYLAKIVELMTGTVSPEAKDKIDREIEAIDVSKLVVAQQPAQQAQTKQAKDSNPDSLK